MRTAIVHDWLVTYAGAERVLEAVLKCFPGQVHTLVHHKEPFRSTPLADLEPICSFIQRLPWARRLYRYYLPLFPLAIEQFDLSWADVVISISTCVAKGVITKADQFHVCYCCTPVRYAWDLYHQYMAMSPQARRARGLLARLVLHYLRMWDRLSESRVDLFVTLSSHVARRIKKIYGRDAVVVPPPVRVGDFEPCLEKDDYYVAVSRLVPYKRLDLVMKAFSRMRHRRLLVVGDGPDAAHLKAMAPSNVRFLGHQPFSELRRLLSKAKALIHAAEEDFGIVMVEAQACSTPVVAYGVGGAVDIVRPDETGVIFMEQTPDALVEAVERLETSSDLDPEAMRGNAERFDEAIFIERFSHLVEDALSRWWSSSPKIAP